MDKTKLKTPNSFALANTPKLSSGIPSIGSPLPLAGNKGSTNGPSNFNLGLFDTIMTVSRDGSSRKRPFLSSYRNAREALIGMNLDDLARNFVFGPFESSTRAPQEVNKNLVNGGTEDINNSTSKKRKNPPLETPSSPYNLRSKHIKVDQSDSQNDSESPSPEKSNANGKSKAEKRKSESKSGTPVKGHTPPKRKRD